MGKAQKDRPQKNSEAKGLKRNRSGAARPGVVLTIGHSKRALEDFLQMLPAHRVTLLVDVRKMPGSRKNPQFDQDRLSRALREAGIGYLHVPGLGGLRCRTPNSPNSGWRNASFQAFADYMLTDEFEKSLTELIDRARDERAALMCAEAVPWRCHRSLIADALVVRGIPVEDIFTATRAEPHVLHSFARVEGTRITYPPE